MDLSFSDLNFNSVETLPGFEARAAFTVNSGAVFREDVDIIPTIVDDTLSYVPWGGDNQMPFDLLDPISPWRDLQGSNTSAASISMSKNIERPDPKPRRAIGGALTCVPARF